MLPLKPHSRVKEDVVEALIFCTIPCVVFGVMALFGLKPKERRALEGHPEKDYEYSHKERVS